VGGRTGANGLHVREHFIFPCMMVAALQSQLGKKTEESRARVCVDLVLNKFVEIFRTAYRPASNALQV
jgi:hypothetical protein